jgi:hypothetical protein
MPTDTRIDIDSGLSGLDSIAWFTQLEDVAEDLGSFTFLGKYHSAALIEAGPKLLVTFENAASIIENEPSAEPVGFHHVRYDGWSHLGIYANSESWYRDPFVYAYFDRLSDEGFFDNYDDVLFYGVNASAYAAAAYSVAAPGSRVLAIRPQATLDPRITGFDQRFRKFRRQDFQSRYGYAPDMLDAADQAYIAFDPLLPLDAMHAALFTRPNVAQLRCTGFGGRIDQGFETLDIRDEVMRAALHGELTAEAFGTLFRARRDHVPYLRKLFAMTMEQGRLALAEKVCVHAIRVGHRPFFADRLDELRTRGR